MRSLKALLAFAVFIGLVYVAYRIVPVYMSSYQLQDAIEEEARLDAYSNKPEQDIKDSIFKKAQSLDIPITSDQIKVQRQGAGVSISTAYTVHIDLPVHPLDLSFTPNSASRRAF